MYASQNSNVQYEKYINFDIKIKCNIKCVVKNELK